MATPGDDPRQLLARCLESDRLHSAYLLSGPGSAPRAAALDFARALACTRRGPWACDGCLACRRSAERDAIALDGTGKSGPLLRHVGDHPDLLWVERGRDDTRVRIAQIRALQHALHLRGEGDGRRAAVIADAEWLNLEAQNALLRLLEEPPPRTTLVLVSATSAGLLATLRSRCQRVVFPAGEPTGVATPEGRGLAERLTSLARASLPELLDWAEEYRGSRAEAAESVHHLLDAGGAWLRESVHRGVATPGAELRPALDASRTLAACRQELDQRNANPQMVAERALLALRAAAVA